MHVIRPATNTPQEAPVPKSTFSPNTAFSRPVLHGRSSSPHQVSRDGVLNLAPQGSIAIHPSRQFNQPFGAPQGSRIAPAGLTPRDPSIPHLTPRVHEVTHYDEGENYMPRNLEECMMDAYNFNLNFRKRGMPPFPQEAWDQAAPARKAILTKRHQSHVKRAQQPVQVQREVQWQSLLRRDQRAAERGDAGNLFTPETTHREVVEDRRDQFRARRNYFGMWNRLIGLFCIINFTWINAFAHGFAHESPFRFLLSIVRRSMVVSSAPILYITSRTSGIISRAPLKSFLLKSPASILASIEHKVSSPVTTLRLDIEQRLATSERVGACLPMGVAGPNSHTDEQTGNPNRRGRFSYCG